MKPVRILLADDHRLLLAGLRSLLDRNAAVEVVAEAGDEREALRLIEETRPDVVLLGVNTRRVGTVILVKEIAKRFPSVRVLVLEREEDEHQAFRAFEAGAAGYLPPQAEISELEHAIQTVARGGTFVPSEVSRGSLVRYLTTSGRQAGLTRVLTPRQVEVLSLIANGASTREIARMLDISVKTVESHRAHLMERLGIHNVTGLVRYAIKARLIKVG